MLLIANPKAGLKKIRRALPGIKRFFESSGYEVEVYETSGRGDGTEAAKRLSSGRDLVVCAGGDGTLNEVIAGLMALEERPPLGYIPAGSTNDFASSLGLPLEFKKAANYIICGQPREIDIGSLNGRYFSYVASFGAFTEVSYSASQPLKNSLGHLAYVLEGVKELGNIRPRHMKIEVDGKEYEDDYLFGAVSNSTSLGGVLKLNSGIVDFSDGLFEIMLIKNPKNAVELSKIVLSLQTKKYDEEVITFLQASSAVFYSDENTPWSLDGEYFEGGSILSIENISKAIRFISC